MKQHLGAVAKFAPFNSWRFAFPDDRLGLEFIRSVSGRGMAQLLLGQAAAR
jgi:hypothetical protein